MTDRIQIGDWVFTPSTHQLERAGKVLMLENRQAQVLLFLARNGGRDVSKDELLALWRPRVVNDDALYVCIGNLRKALGDDPRAPVYIKTLPGFGYRFLASSCDLENKSWRRAHWLAAIPAVVVLAIVTMAIMSVTDTQSHAEPPLVKVPVEIEDDYYLARFLLTQDASQHPDALELLRKIMTVAPAFADAYALAAHQRVLDLLGKSVDKPMLDEINGWIDRALALEPGNKQAHLARANLLFMVDWNFAQARRHYELALESAQSYLFFAQFLLAMGEYEQALEYSYRHQHLDPKGYAVASVAWIRTMAGQYELALESIDQLHALQPDNFYYHVYRAAIFEQLSDETNAFAEMRWLMEKAGYSADNLDQVESRFATGGLAAVYAWLAEEDLQQLDIGQYRPPLSLARYSVGAGEYDRAMTLLQQAVNQRQMEVLWLAADPKYRPLHGRPAFDALLKQMGYSGP